LHIQGDHMEVAWRLNGRVLK